MTSLSALYAALGRARHGLRLLLGAHRSLLVTNLLAVFLPVLLVQLAAPSFMRGRTSPLPGGALLGAGIVLLLVGAATRIAYTRARRALPPVAPSSRRPYERLVLIGASLVVILLGQAVLSGIAELIGVVRPAEAGPGAAFAIDYPRYVAVTSLAYTWTVSVLTLLVVSLRLGSAASRAEAKRPGWPWPAKAAALAAAAIGMVVLGLKVSQHLG